MEQGATALMQINPDDTGGRARPPSVRVVAGSPRTARPAVARCEARSACGQRSAACRDDRLVRLPASFARVDQEHDAPDPVLGKAPVAPAFVADGRGHLGSQPREMKCPGNTVDIGPWRCMPCSRHPEGLVAIVGLRTSILARSGTAKNKNPNRFGLGFCSIWWWGGTLRQTTIESTQSKRCGPLRTIVNSIEMPAGL